MSDSPRAWALLTPRLRLSPYHPQEAEGYAAAVAGSLETLQPFMPFAAEAPDPLAYAELFEVFQRRFHDGDYTFGIHARDGGRILGGSGLHPSVGPLGREIGYWVLDSETGQGFATEALAALCHLAFVQEDVDRVELRIEPHNAASIRVADNAGFTREGLLRRRLPWPNEAPRDCVVYTLFADDWPDSPGAAVPVERLAASGRPIP